MDLPEMADLLARIDERTKNIVDLLDRAAHGEGFPRCAARGERISEIEKRVDKVEKTQKWAWGTITTAILTALFGWLFQR